MCWSEGSDDARSARPAARVTMNRARGSRKSAIRRQGVEAKILRKTSGLAAAPALAAKFLDVRCPALGRASVLRRLALMAAPRKRVYSRPNAPEDLPPGRRACRKP